MESLNKRRFRQYSLRGMLAMIAMLALIFAWVSRAVHTASNSMRAISELMPGWDSNPGWQRTIQRGGLGQGMGVSLACNTSTGGVGSITLERPSAWLKRVAGAMRVKLSVQVTAIQIDSSEFGDENLKALLAIPSLRSISIANTRVTDTGLQHLRSLKNLRQVDIATGNQAISDTGVDKLAASLPAARVARVSPSNGQPQPSVARVSPAGAQQSASPR